MVENSNFIWDEDWQRQKDYISTIIQQFDDSARFGLITFNDMGFVEIEFDDYSNTEDLLRRV